VSATETKSAPQTDATITAISQLVDDAQAERREPSHSDLAFIFERHKLLAGDPKTQGQNFGKAKRVRATLSWALEHCPDGGGECIHALLGSIRGFGGFRSSSPNFVGEHVIENAKAAFDGEGYLLTSDGALSAKLLDNLSGPAITDALKAYIRRAKRGSDDAALIVGTSKDLLEAIAAHILLERGNQYSTTANFPMLLGQTFIALGSSCRPRLEPGGRCSRGLFPFRIWTTLPWPCHGLATPAGTNPIVPAGARSGPRLK
jgi:hypothetical protein